MLLEYCLECDILLIYVEISTIMGLVDIEMDSTSNITQISSQIIHGLTKDCGLCGIISAVYRCVGIHIW